MQKEIAVLHLPRTSGAYWQWILYKTITLHCTLGLDMMGGAQLRTSLSSACPSPRRANGNDAYIGQEQGHSCAQPATDDPGYLPSYYIHTHAVLSPPNPSLHAKPCAKPSIYHTNSEAQSQGC